MLKRNVFSEHKDNHFIFYAMSYLNLSACLQHLSIIYDEKKFVYSCNIRFKMPENTKGWNSLIWEKESCGVSCRVSCSVARCNTEWINS